MKGKITRRQELGLIGLFMVFGAFLGIPIREMIANSFSPNPTDFTALFLTIFQRATLIDFLVSLPMIGLLFIMLADVSFGAIFGFIVLDHRSVPISQIVGLSMIGVFELTAQVMAGTAGFRALDLIDARRLPGQRMRYVFAYLKFLALALLITSLSALFETASILGMLPFGL